MAKKPGRPSLDGVNRSVKVCFCLPPRDYDALYERARRERLDVADLIRADIAKSQRRQNDHDDE